MQNGQQKLNLRHKKSAKWVLWPAGNSVSCGNNGRCQDWYRDTFSDCCF